MFTDLKCRGMAMWRSVLAALCLVVLAACGQGTQGASQTGEQVLIASVAVAPYPDAVEVRVFVSDLQGGEQVEARKLSLPERQAFEQTLKLNNYDRGPEYAAACFVPHHFFRYFDAAGKQVGEISVCFCCGGTASTPNIAASLPKGATYQELVFKYEALETLLKSWDIEIGC